MSQEKTVILSVSFNTQPPEGGCGVEMMKVINSAYVSTHSRPKAAAPYIKK